MRWGVIRQTMMLIQWIHVVYRIGWFGRFSIGIITRPIPASSPRRQKHHHVVKPPKDRTLRSRKLGSYPDRTAVFLSFLDHLPLAKETLRNLRGDESLAKPIIKLFRFGKLPLDRTSTLFKSCAPIVDLVWTYNPETSLYSHRRGDIDYTSEVFTPVVRGLMISAASMYDSSWEKDTTVKRSSYLKEVDVMRSERTVEEINFLPFFAFSHVYEEVHDYLPDNHQALVYYQKIFTKFRHWLSKQVLYPTMSTKLVSSRAKVELEHKYSHILIEYPESLTQASLERVYVITGNHLEGPSELKQRWYTNGQIPRSYFVAGPTCYAAAKFMRKPLNKLCDIPPCTSFMKRVDVTRLRFPTSDHLATMYDFTSFTSNMGIQVPFLKQLAGVMSDCHTHIMDGRLGYSMVSFGNLLSTYVDAANDFPEWYCDSPLFESNFTESHRVAGFLGVLGNISSCTFLHGMLLSQFLSDPENFSCAGDDALFFEKSIEEALVVLEGMTLAGILNPDKAHFLSELLRDALYLKRAITTQPDSLNLELEPYITPVSLIFLMKGLLDRYREDDLDQVELNKITISSLLGFARSCADFGVVDSDEPIVCDILSTVYETIGIPKEGNLPEEPHPRCPKAYQKLFIPPYDCFWSFDPIGTSIDILCPELVKLPRDVSHLVEVLVDISGLEEFLAWDSKGLEYLVRLGVLASEEIEKETYPRDVAMPKLLAKYYPPKNKTGDRLEKEGLQSSV